MKKYLIIGGVCFALGAGTLFASGITDDVTYLSNSFASRNKQALRHEASLNSHNLERAKLDLELERIKFQIKKRGLELELETLNKMEDVKKEEAAKALSRAEEVSWWLEFTKIFWLLMIAIVMPLLALTALVIKVSVSLMRGRG